jgi:hypothetical protein
VRYVPTRAKWLVLLQTINSATASTATNTHAYADASGHGNATNWSNYRDKRRYS